MPVNVGALLAVAAFAGVLLFVFGLLYLGASRSRARGELDPEGIRILKWALLGHLTIFAILATSAFLT
jgi:hypothetical protein